MSCVVLDENGNHHNDKVSNLSFNSNLYLNISGTAADCVFLLRSFFLVASELFCESLRRFWGSGETKKVINEKPRRVRATSTVSSLSLLTFIHLYFSAIKTLEIKLKLLWIAERHSLSERNNGIVD